MKTNTLIGLIVGFLVGGIIGWAIGYTPSKELNMTNPQIGIGGAPLSQPTISSKELDFRMDMRRLWEDHVAWTRMYLVSAMADADDTDAVANRLLKNQEDIGSAISPYYGNDSGNRLTALLKEHIIIATEVAKAAKANDNRALEAANTKWFNNADQIADFLSKANPNWSRAELQSMLRDHLNLTKQEAVNILNKRFEENIADYDQVRNQILAMADTLSSGIIKQFPDKFR